MFARKLHLLLLGLPVVKGGLGGLVKSGRDWRSNTNASDTSDGNRLFVNNERRITIIITMNNKYMNKKGLFMHDCLCG